MSAGFVMTMNSQESIERSMHDGVYATVLRQPDGYWGAPGYGTFADYASMKPGDNVYFFHDRQLYGVGELTLVGGACAHLNFPEASQPRTFEYQDVRTSLLYDLGEESTHLRWLCTFRPSPMFFRRGVDMDEALSAHPGAFRMLRVLWKLSFIKLDYEENAALRDVLLRANRGVFHDPGDAEAMYESAWESVHSGLSARRTDAYNVDVAPLLASAANGDAIRSEKAIEAAVLQYLSQGDSHAEDVFGTWDYVSHQVAASPFKPPDWMDKVDVFGAAFVRGYAPSISSLLVAELKKDGAGAAFVEQVMKYVDWVKDEYAHQDYSHIRAFLLAHDFDESAFRQQRDAAVRTYTVGRRPPVSKEWRDLTLVSYRYDAETQRLRFEVAAAPRP
jgi:hypothetical protein